MEPTRDLGATLPDLLEVLLNKGVYLDLDLIITVADIPLIGVNLRATIAGIETMLEYGMMRSWDEQTREWVRRSVSRHVPLAEDEEIVMRMAGGHRQDEPHGTWRPGTVYLTSRRLIVWRADPREVLWQVRLEDVAGATCARNAASAVRTASGSSSRPRQGPPPSPPRRRSGSSACCASRASDPPRRR
ncbi:gas vesicle protein [Georgenia sp. SUBG003]|uniref:gas vesicle protein n=1 Tax=Georgenia sp. SUBG003 TaxID=1497974 RepID=UPI003AB88796